MDESSVRAARDLVVGISRLRRRLREVADIDDLTPSQASVLQRLGKDGTSSASALALAEHVRPQSMATILTALDQHGLIARNPDPDDGRRQLITLTDAGRERDHGNRQAREDWLVRALDEHYTEDQRQTIITSMALLEGLAEL